MANEGITITVDGKEYAIDDFEGRELIDVERAFGISLYHELERSSMTGIYAILYLVKKRETPSFTVENALALKLGQVENMIGGENGNGKVDADPPRPAVKARAKKSG